MFLAGILIQIRFCTGFGIYNTNQFMNKFPQWLLIFALLFAFNCTPLPPDWADCEMKEIEHSAPETVSSSDHLVVYLDTSASMNGYISGDAKNSFSFDPDGQTVFSKTLLELRNVVTSLNPQPAIVVRKVDATISTPSFGDLELSQAALNRDLYVGKETNLAGAIKSFSESLDKTTENVAPPRFNILITDGVQSAQQQKTDVSCTQGSDSFCVKKQLLELINKGWGGAILGLRSEFQGNVYSEISKKAVPYSSGKEATKFRPFYLYIFSPDRAALEKLVESLKQKLIPLGKEDALREFALTSDYVNGASTVEFQNENKELIEVKQEKVKDGENPRVTIKADLDTERNDIGKKPFTMIVKLPWSNHAQTAGSEIADLIKWELKLLNSEKEEKSLRYPELKLIKTETQNGVAALTLETGWNKESGTPAWRLFRLVGKLDVDKAAPPWVSAWTTNLDTTADTASKTLNLESSLANLWKNSAMEKKAIAEICIRVGEK